MRQLIIKKHKHFSNLCILFVGSDKTSVDIKNKINDFLSACELQDWYTVFERTQK